MTRVAVIVVLAVLVGLVASYPGQLRWATGELPMYLTGRIGAPEETLLVREARRSLRNGDLGPQVLAKLQRAAAIDPNCSAVYWLGRLHLARERDELALVHLERYLQIDPSRVGAYLGIASVHRRRGDRDAARDVLDRGLELLQRRRERYWPRRDESVARRFNDKATEVYRAYGEAIERLREARAELGDPAID